MTGPLTVPASERGIVRVFALDMPPEQARFLSEPGALDQVLGVQGIDPADAQIIRIADLEEFGLLGYLTEGAGIPPSELAADRARLKALEGHVLVLFSRAFGGRAVTLAPHPGLTLIGAYAVEPTDWRGGPIETDSAKPYSGGARASPRAARSQARRIGGLVFAVVMLLIALALLIWLA